MNFTYATKVDVLLKAQKAIGIPFKYLDKSGRLGRHRNKGGIGQVVEEGHFGYSPNSDAEPDFKAAGVELKVTPYRRNFDGSISAKERLVLNIIDYMTEYESTFEESGFWKKNKSILMMLYEYSVNKAKGDFSISHAFLYEYPLKDLVIIKNDWERIVSKVRAGLADELSEGDTLYLGACTKGTNATSLRTQPFSDKMAKQRAYSLKQSYMTGILRRYIFGNNCDERIIHDVKDLRNASFEELISSRLRPYFGRTRSSLLDEFKINGKSKDASERIIARILGVTGKLSQTEEFRMANILPKTIRLSQNGAPEESMSFKAFKFIELLCQHWEDSDLKELFESTKFMFIVFRIIEDGEQVFEGITFWNMPQSDISEVEKVWLKTVEIIREGVRLRLADNRVYNNFPKSSDNRIAHVRPHARDREDVDELPDGTMTKQCFWLNRTYVMEILKEAGLIRNPKGLYK